MIVVIAFVILIVLAVYHLVRIGLRKRPRVRLSELGGWSKSAWITSLILLSIGAALLVRSIQIQFQWGGLHVFESDPASWAGLVQASDLALLGAHVMALLCLAIAFWRPGVAALLLGAVALLAPATVFLQAAISPVVQTVDDQFAVFIGASQLILFVSVPAMLTAVLLGITARLPRNPDDAGDVPRPEAGSAAQGQADRPEPVTPGPPLDGPPGRS